MNRTLAPLVLAMLVQGFVFVALTPSDYRVLVVGALVLLAGLAGVWAARLERKAVSPLVDLIARLSAIAPGSGSQPPAPRASAIERMVYQVHQRIGSTLAETRRLRAQAEEAGVYKTAFLRAVAHELRTPLNGILGFTDILLSGLEGELSDDRKENLEVIGHAGRRLLSLFNDAIELSAMASGQLSLRREPVDLRDLLEQVVSGLEARRELRPVHVALRGDDAELVVSGQRERLLRVFEALGDYALRHTESGIIEFNATSDAITLQVVMRMSVPPVDRETAQSLFLPERAGDSDVRRDALRLAIAKQLVELHGGQLSYDLEASERRFIATLPANVSVNAPASASISGAPSPQGSST